MNAHEVVALTRALVEFDTSNPPGNEAEAAHFLGDFLAGHGLEIEYQEVEPGRPNLIARLRGRGKGGHLVFSGHMDVVPVGEEPWAHFPFAADVVDGRMIGRGTADMKGGVAAMAAAVAQLARDDFVPKFDIVLAISMNEEAGMTGAKHMAATGILVGSAYLIICEPTDLNLCIAQKGTRRWLVTAHGKGAHSSTPHLGVSAIAYAARLVPALEANPFSFTRHPLLGAPTVTVNGIESWGAPNVVPDVCLVRATVRTVPGQEPDMLDEHLQATLDAAARESELPVRTDVELLGGVPPIETAPDHPLVRAAVDAVTTITGSRPALCGFTGATEASILAPAFDVPAIILGPGSLSEAHQVNESVALDELAAAVDVYALLMRTLAGP